MRFIRDPRGPLRDACGLLSQAGDVGKRAFRFRGRFCLSKFFGEHFGVHTFGRRRKRMSFFRVGLHGMTALAFFARMRARKALLS